MGHLPHLQWLGPSHSESLPCLNHVKKQENNRTVPFDPKVADQVPVQPEAANYMESLGRRERIDRTLARMSPVLRIPLVMRDMDDFSYEEIAASLGFGRSAIKMRIKRARETFRDLYGNPRTEGAQGNG